MCLEHEQWYKVGAALRPDPHRSVQAGVDPVRCELLCCREVPRSWESVGNL